MGSLWLDLLPLILASALVPSQATLGMMFLQRGRGGLLSATTFTSGIMVVRLLQGLVFGLITPNGPTADTSLSATAFASILLVLGVVLLATAISTALANTDPDAPPPKWLLVAESVSPARAFLLGVGLLLISPKFWVVTLGAITAIGNANLRPWITVFTYLAFVILCSAVLITLILIRILGSKGSRHALKGGAVWLEQHNRLVVVIVSAVFGTWFLTKGLAGLGLI